MGARNPGPRSLDRRRVLLTLGFAAANAVTLSQLPRRRAQLRTTILADGGAGAGSATATATQDPPALEGADPEPAAPHTFATVITGGRVIDPETGFDDVADVGIDGDRITAISRDPLAGTRTIDASGRVVAPGFVDILSYDPNGYGEWFKIADGVTTNLAMHGIDGDAASFFSRIGNAGSPVHYGGAYDAPNRRAYAFDLQPGDEASADDLAAMADDCRAQLAAGFIGVDLEPEYAFNATYEELRTFAAVAAETGVCTYVHGRYSDDQAPGTNDDTLREILQLSRDTGSSVHVEHLISTGGTFTMAASLATLDAARAEGIDVTACMYPYDYWATYLGSARFADGWQERFHISYGDLEVAGTGERLTESTFAARQADNLLVAAYGIPEADVVTCLQSPYVMIASDGILEPGDNNHPRAAGCFSRTLGRYVRDEGVLSLVDALAKMTILPAKRVEAAAPAMARKGRLQRGADADVVVFDPDTIIDRATVRDPSQEAAGIDWVLVAGVPVKTPDGVDQSQRPGRPITGAS
jgi:N-acyl-D-aspartate/D-glutamate deacylase